MPWLAGLSLQVCSTAIFIANPSAAVLLIARALQGLSAAVVYSVGLALLVDTVGHEQIGEQAGFVLSSANLGVLISPTLGGIVYARSGYYAVVGMMVGLVLMDVVLRVVVIEKKVAAKWTGVPALPQGDDLAANGHDEETPQIAALLSNRRFEDAGDAQDRRARQMYGEQQPLLSRECDKERARSRVPPLLRLLASARVFASCYAVFAGYTLLSGFDSGLALFVKRTFGWNSTGAGLIFLTIALPSLAAPLAGRCADLFGPRWMIIGGFSVTAVCLFLLRLVTHGGFKQIVLLCILMTLVGLYKPNSHQMTGKPNT